jgi:hypothetical protein
MRLLSGVGSLERIAVDINQSMVGILTCVRFSMLLERWLVDHKLSALMNSLLAFRWNRHCKMGGHQNNNFRSL